MDGNNGNFLKKFQINNDYSQKIGYYNAEIWKDQRQNEDFR